MELIKRKFTAIYEFQKFGVLSIYLVGGGRADGDEGGDGGGEEPRHEGYPKEYRGQ